MSMVVTEGGQEAKEDTRLMVEQRIRERWKGARHGDSMEVRRNVTKTIHDITNLSYVPKCLGHLEIMMVPTFLQSQRIPTQDILLI